MVCRSKATRSPAWKPRTCPRRRSRCQNVVHHHHMPPRHHRCIRHKKSATHIGATLTWLQSSLRLRFPLSHQTRRPQLQHPLRLPALCVARGVAKAFHGACGAAGGSAGVCSRGGGGAAAEGGVVDEPAHVPRRVHAHSPLPPSTSESVRHTDPSRMAMVQTRLTAGWRPPPQARWRQAGGPA